MIVDTFREEFETWKRSLPAEITSDLKELARPAGAGRAVQLAVETAGRAAEVTVWESGEADLVVGDLSTGGIVANEHLEITSRLGIRGLLDDVAEAVSA